MAHGDYTGSRKIELAQRFAEQQQLKAKETSLITAVVEENRNQTIDLRVDEDYQALETAHQGTDGETLVDVDTKHLQFVKFRASDTVENVNIGKDRYFNLEAGQTYIAPRWLVTHLDEKQLVWH